MEHLVETLSDHVHQAWMAEKLNQGFADHTYSCLGSAPEWCQTVSGCQRSASMHHSDMLPYAELPEHIKEYDRVTVRAVLAGIESEGYRLWPKT